MIGIGRTVLGVVIVFDVVATFGGAAIATLGGVAVPTLGVALTRDGASGVRDMIADSCVITARCFIFALWVWCLQVSQNVANRLQSLVVL